jgi:tetratricopeptide (TPR) repeat protein
VPTVDPAPPQPAIPAARNGGGGGGAIQSQPAHRSTGKVTVIVPGGTATVESVETSSEDAFDETPEQREVTVGVMEEENNLNLDAAIQRYQQALAKFDSRRTAAAQAVFRLGECYRKMGRMEEAKVQYARVLREFSDQEALVKASQGYLFGKSGYALQTRLDKIVKRHEPIVTKKESTVTITNESVSSSDLTPEHGAVAAAAARRGKADQQKALLLKQAEEVRQRFKMGMASNNAADKLQRDLLISERERIASAMAAARATMKTLDPATGLPAGDLELIRRESAKAELESLLKEREADEAVAKEDAVKRQQDKPELLAPVLGTDPVYMKLKGEYEMALLDASGAEAGADEKKKVELASKRLAYYVKDICLPQLSEMSKYARRKLDFSKEIAKTLKNHLNEMEAAQAAGQKVTNTAPKAESAPETPGPAQNVTY